MLVIAVSVYSDKVIYQLAVKINLYGEDLYLNILTDELALNFTLILVFLKALIGKEVQQPSIKAFLKTFDADSQEFTLNGIGTFGGHFK